MLINNAKAERKTKKLSSEASAREFFLNSECTLVQISDPPVAYGNFIVCINGEVYSSINHSDYGSKDLPKVGLPIGIFTKHKALLFLADETADYVTATSLADAGSHLVLTIFHKNYVELILINGSYERSFEHLFFPYKEEALTFWVKSTIAFVAECSATNALGLKTHLFGEGGSNNGHQKEEGQ